MKKTSIFLGIILLVVTRHTSAAVVINEIAWMGTSTSANAEWIELFNNGVESATLEGWTLKAADGSPSITLSGSIASGSYFLLERTSDESVPNIVASQIYSGSLGNTSEHLELKDNLNVTVDDVDATAGWPAGDNTTKQTMSRSGSVWITVEPTPFAENKAAVPTNPIPTQPGTSDSQKTTSVIPITKDDPTADVISIKPDPKYTAKMVLPDFATAGTSVPLSVVVKQDSKRNMVDGRFEWYFGDGSDARYLKNTSFDHTFYYPGDYTIVMEYYSNYFKEEPDSIHKKVISIVTSAISIAEITDDGGIVFLNESSKEIDLGNWKLAHGKDSYSFPKYTIVPKGKTLSVPKQVLGMDLDPTDVIQLMNSNNVAVAHYPVPEGGEL